MVTERNDPRDEQVVLSTTDSRIYDVCVQQKNSVAKISFQNTLNGKISYEDGNMNVQSEKALHTRRTLGVIFYYGNYRTHGCT